MTSTYDLQNLRKFLNSLSTLPVAEWDFLQKRILPRKISSGEILLNQGDPAQDIFFVLKGLLKTSFLEKEGQQISKGFVPENELCAAYVSILTAAPSTMMISALEDSWVVGIQASLLSELYGRHPCWQEVGRKIAESLLIDKEKREYQMLALSAEERYSQFQQNFKNLLNRIPQYEIASYLGITPVGLSQIRRKIALRRT